MSTQFINDLYVSSGKIIKTETASYGDTSETVLYDPLVHSDHVLISVLTYILNEGKKERSKELKTLLGL